MYKTFGINNDFEMISKKQETKTTKEDWKRAK